MKDILNSNEQTPNHHFLKTNLILKLIFFLIVYVSCSDNQLKDLNEIVLNKKIEPYEDSAINDNEEAEYRILKLSNKLKKIDPKETGEPNENEEEEGKIDPIDDGTKTEDDEETGG
ncbi:hypothetical protein [Tenacibaculum sp. 190524A02b]|uniref:hypothetical protein n=1 Tax=Tenacibaculum vairaonense TaxID=3137860 RepID=UPI0031FA7A76